MVNNAGGFGIRLGHGSFGGGGAEGKFGVDGVGYAFAAAGFGEGNVEGERHVDEFEGFGDEVEVGGYFGDSGGGNICGRSEGMGKGKERSTVAEEGAA